MNHQSISQAKNSDFRSALTAMQRAAQEARRIAKQFNMPVIVQKDGKLIKQTVQ